MTAIDPVVNDLLQLASRRGWMGYEELNSALPDEMVDPERIDDVLVHVDALGLRMLDLREFKAEVWREMRKRGEMPVKPEPEPVIEDSADGEEGGSLLAIPPALG